MQTGMKQGEHMDIQWSQAVGCCRLHQMQGVFRTTSRTVGFVSGRSTGLSCSARGSPSTCKNLYPQNEYKKK